MRIGVILVLGIPLCLLAVGMFAPFALLVDSALPAAVVGLCGVGLILWLLSRAVGSVIETFFSTCWTLAY